MSTSDAGQRTGIRYTTGKARVIVRGDAVVVLPGADAGGTAGPAAELWADLATPGAGVAEVLGTLTSSAVGGLQGVPPFAVVVLSRTGAGEPASAHVVARGDGLTVTIETGDGIQTVSGAGVISWTERVVDGVTAVEVATGVSGFGSFAEGLPVESGVVLAGVVRQQVVEQAGPSTPVELSTSSDPVEAEHAPVERAGLVDEVPTAAQPVNSPAALTAALVGANAPAPLPATDSAAGSAAGSAAETATESATGSPAESAPMGTVTMVPASEETITPAEDGGEPAQQPEADLPADDSPDDDYMHLWGATVAHGVEAAAVRPESAEEEDEQAPAPAAPPAPPAPPSPAPVAAPAHPAPEAAGSDGMISGVPIAGVPGFLGATPAAAHRAAAVGADASPDGADDDDHDGHTVMSSAIADLKAAAASPSAPKFTANPNAPRILAVTCANGHPNPTARENCRECGSALDAEASLAARPSLGRMVVTSGTATGGAAGVRGGQVIELDRPVIIGRRPRSNNTSADQVPRLVTVSSPQQDISRSHTEITLEDWHVLVTDLATTNGTTLLRPGQPPRRLHPNEKELVSDGDVVDMGDGVTLTFEDIW